MSPDLAKAFNIKADQKGAVIARIEETSPADQAGLKPGDVIVPVNERNVRDASDLRNMIGLLRVGQRIKLVAIRNGEKLDISAEITAANKEMIEGNAVNRTSRCVLLNIQRGSGAIFLLIQ